MNQVKDDYDPAERAIHQGKRINHFKTWLSGFIDCHKMDTGFHIFNKKSVDRYRYQIERCGHSIKLKDCNEGDRVIALIARVSSSQSTWCQFTGKHHGYILFYAFVSVDDDGKRRLSLTMRDRQLFEKPCGREKYAQEINLYNNIVLEVLDFTEVDRNAKNK